LFVRGKSHPGYIINIKKDFDSNPTVLCINKTSVVTDNTIYNNTILNPKTNEPQQFALSKIENNGFIDSNNSGGFFKESHSLSQNLKLKEEFNLILNDIVSDNQPCGFFDVSIEQDILCPQTLFSCSKGCSTICQPTSGPEELD